MAVKSSSNTVTFDVPHIDRSTPTGHRQRLAIRGERDRGGIEIVERCDLVTARRIPQCDNIASRLCKRLAIRRTGNGIAVQRTAVPLKRKTLPP